MAAVTLKDLMDPLSKIEAAAKETNEKLDALIAVSTGGGSGGGQMAIISELQTQTMLLKQIAFNTNKVGEYSSRNLANFIFTRAHRKELLKTLKAQKGDTGKGGKEKVKGQGAQALKDLGMGALLTGKAMMIWALVPKKVVNKFLDFVVNSFERFESFNVKKVKKGVDTLSAMGGAILKFSKALALSAILLIPGMIAIPFLILSMTVVGGAFALLGGKKMSNRINRGAKALDRVGDALKSFAIGLGLFALSTMFIILAPPVLLGMVASLILIPGAVAILGGKKMSKRIKRGAKGLAILGLALIPFAIGLVIFSLATKGNGIGDVLIQGATILAIGGAAALVGKFGTSNILQGALALAVNGIGLAIFSYGYVPFAKATKGLGLGDILVQSGILLAVGGIMALAGLAVAASAGTVLLGPALYAAAGLALQELAPGLAAMKKVDFKEKEAKDLSYTLGAVAAAFSGVDSDAGFLKNVGNVFSRIGQSVVGGGAAAMYSSAGEALQNLSKGLAAFKAIGFTEEDSKELAIALGSVSGAFAQAGGEPASPGGLFGAVFGNTFSPNATERGIDSVMDSGKALKEITKGLGAFLDLKKKYKLDGDAFKDGGYLNTAISETLGFLNSAFAAIGSNETSDSAMFGLFQWDENNVEKGIDAVKGSGKALTDITTGLKSFLDLQIKYGLTSESFADDGYLSTAVKDTLGFVSKAFATIGGMETEDSWGIFSWDENSVEKGVDAVKGAGQELTNIATGLKTFQEMVDKDIDFKEGGTLAKAVSNSLSFVSTAFSAIGGMETTDGWFIFSWDENSVEKGINAVKGAGAELSNIANGLKTFADMSETVDFKANGKLAKAVANSLSFVGSAFMKIGGMESSDSNWLFSWDENAVQKGIEAVDGAGAALTDIAEGLKSFAELENSAAIATSIETLFTSIGDTFAKYYKDESFRTDLDHMQGFITELSMYAQDGSLAKAATDIQSISNAVNSIDSMKAESFANLFKGAGELSNNEKAYAQLADAVEEIRDILSSQGSNIGDAVGGAISNAFGGGSDEKTSSNNNGGLNKSMNKINSTLSQLNSTMVNLPVAISNLVDDDQR